MKVVRATLKDVNGLLDLEKTCFAGMPRCQMDKEELEKYIKREDEVLVLIVHRGRKVAGAAVVFLMDVTVNLYSIATSPDFQKQGIGQALLNAAIALSKGDGREKMRLEVDIKNESAKNWYIKNGFKPTGDVAKDYLYEGSVSDVLEREL